VSESYEVYPAGGREPAPEPDPRADGDAGPAGTGTLWYVMVEYSNQGQAKPPTVVKIVAGPFDGRDRAREAAREEAVAFRPPDPMSPKKRVVYQLGDDELMTFVEGAMSTFHFRTFTAQLLGSRDE